MALFLNTAGGAWDNAKKYIESGAHGGKEHIQMTLQCTGSTLKTSIWAGLSDVADVVPDKVPLSQTIGSMSSMTL